MNIIKKIQILGPFNTGTNLISKILNDNLSEDIYIESEGHTLLFKHILNKKNIINTINSNQDTLFICIYKPIHNWICSIRKASYGISWSKK